ncbi:PREDICTED: tetratricopeptide repeat protein 25 isoform X1 [Bactrocera latifrons]|uniref:tetratricopeptide repeat protein 25 isoform X1 n=1 Tax=Bactrocera latifrons TaxID=174628 RepID=UPI0008DD2E5E|nr:PREDICTED: tetratricopeptide repeat protein 25 isoform X1 [Bactrocera latifrons]
MSSVLKNILDVDKEQELLQSFIRIGITADEESIDESTRKLNQARYYSSPRSRHSYNGKSLSNAIKGVRNLNSNRKTVKFADDVEKSGVGGRGNRIEAELRAARRKTEDQLFKKKPKENFVDFYTDKDRAAAVSAGTYDIKQSLQIKHKQDRNEIMQIPDEADINSIIALGLKEIKNANPENAVYFFSQALELNGTDINALVSRSKCYLLLGEPSKALQDAETALTEDKNNIRAIFQKAESLYFLGQFEQSLMFFHQGLRARPELSTFRLGVQKTQEAIENTIGTSKCSSLNIAPKSANNKISTNSNSNKQSQKNVQHSNRPKLSKAEIERHNARKLLGELCVDKEYLEKLLKHPDLVRGDTNSENISNHANEAVKFLIKRQEFWRQQRPCTSLTSYKTLPQEPLPDWF